MTEDKKETKFHFLIYIDRITRTFLIVEKYLVSWISKSNFCSEQT